MRRALFVMLVTAACGGQAGPSAGVGAPTSQQYPGAATPKDAMNAFMAAIKVQDLDQLAVIWGSEKGPARETVPSDQLRKRELIMECYLQHDKYEIKSDVESTATIHIMIVAVTKGSFTRNLKTQVVKGPNDRWYVANPELEALQDLCSGSAPPR